jgi:hypothetical protein
MSDDTKCAIGLMTFLLFAFVVLPLGMHFFNQTGCHAEGRDAYGGLDPLWCLKR